MGTNVCTALYTLHDVLNLVLQLCTLQYYRYSGFRKLLFFDMGCVYIDTC
jgi:hypothetical protein